MQYEWVVKQESKKAIVVITHNSTSIDKTTIVENASRTVPLCSNDKFQRPQISSVVPDSPETRRLPSTNRSTTDSTARPGYLL